MAIFDKTEEQKTDVKIKTGFKPASGLHHVLIQPRISEKASKSSQAGKYIFEVDKNSNKISIKKAIELAYQVKVIQVNVINSQGKNRGYGKIKGKMSDFKKAIVTLKKGQTINTPE